MDNNQIKQRLSQLCNPEVIEKKLRDELNKALELTDSWLTSPPPEIHAELLISDTFTESRPLDEQVKRLNIALSFLVHALAESMAENNRELLKLLLYNRQT